MRLPRNNKMEGVEEDLSVGWPGMTLASLARAAMVTLRLTSSRLTGTPSEIR